MKDVKKILIDVNAIVPYYVSGQVNGIGRTTLELVHALSHISNLPFDICLYSQNMKGIGGRNTGLPFGNKHLYFPHRASYNRIISKTPLIEWLTKCDVIHIPHNFEYVHCPEKCIATLHDALFMHIQEKAFYHDRMKEIVPPFIQKCKSIITCSEYSKKDIVDTMQIDPAKINVIYWGIKHDVFHPIQMMQKDLLADLPLNLQNEYYYLSVSCSAERKRTDVLIDSYLEYSEQVCLLNDLVLVWSNPPLALRSRIAQSKARDRIHFLSNVTDRQLALLYNGATALFFPSSFEGFGLPILEAMACGTPVVTCHNSSLDEIAADAAIYIKEPIGKGIIEIMKEFEKSSVDCGALKCLGINRASLFTWEHTAQQTVEVYRNILNL